MRCKHCGNPNPDDHRFCGMCGQHLEERVPEPPPARKAEPERSRDVSYLLDETEQENPGGLGRILLLVLGVALIGGFGYMYWLSGGKTATGKPAPSPDTLLNPANTATAKVPAIPEKTVPQVKPADSTTEGSKAAEAAPAASEEPVAAVAPAQAKPAPVVTKPVRLPVAKAAKKPPPKPALSKAAAPAAPKPVQIAPAKPSADLVAQAEKLVYGDGVPQDCDRGLGTMRPLAAAADPRAMIALGALYTTGTCVPRDLPTAYSWYARALHKNPDNLTLEQDMKQIWGQMTLPERQLAIRLSQ